MVGAKGLSHGGSQITLGLVPTPCSAHGAKHNPPQGYLYVVNPMLVRGRAGRKIFLQFLLVTIGTMG